MMTSIVYTIFGITREVIAKHGGSVALAQNHHVAFGDKRYEMKESRFGKTTYDLDILCCEIVLEIPVPSYKTRILSP